MNGQININGSVSIKPSTSIRWTHIASTLVIAWIIGMVDKISVGVVMADKGFLKDTGLLGQPGKLGMLTTAMLIAYAVGMPFWGFIIEKIGARKSLIIGMVIWAVSLTLFGMSSSFSSLLVWRILLGFGEAVLFPACNTYVFNWFPVRERARASSIWYSGTMIGPALAGFTLASVITSFGWRSSFYVLVVATVVITIPMALFLTRNKPSEHGSVSVEESAFIEAGRTLNPADVDKSAKTNEKLSYAFLKDFRFWMITLAFLFNNCFFWAWSTWLPTYLHQARELPLQTMGNITTLIYGCSLITIYGSAYLSDKLMRRAPFGAIGFLLGAVLVFSAVHAANLTTTIVCLVGGMMCQQVGALMINPLLQHNVNNINISRATGTLNFVSQGFSTLSPFIVGVLIGGSGSFILSFSIMASCLLLASICTAVLVKQKY
jgi:ACS family glucarate transporter-like MFS transporter